jgi:predicted DCC family thiol-disulfide oxidoreductase YuxK
MPSWRIKILMDGACPVCRHEALVLSLLDLGRHRLIIEDVAAPGFDPGKYGLSMDQVLDEIHGVLPDGGVVRGMEVFRHTYAALGLGWLLAPTGWPVLRPLADVCYHWLARHRVRFLYRTPVCETGRCGPESGN